MENLYEFMSPTSEVPWLIVRVIAVGLIGWFLYLFWTIRQVQVTHRFLKRTTKTEELATAIRKHSFQTQSDKPIEEDPGSIFAIYCSEHKIDFSHPIGSLLKSIFEAGWHGSHLEIRELIAVASDKITRSENLLQRTQSLFIVLGLLGTLFGLAQTLSEMHLSVADGTIKLESVNQSLQTVFSNLKVAFAPSIWGVFATLLSLLALSFYSKSQGAPLHHQIRNQAIALWLPQLYPTSIQRLGHVLTEAELHVHLSAQAMLKAGKDVVDQTTVLGNNLHQANRALEKFTEVTQFLVRFATDFATATDRIVDFQGQVQALYAQIRLESQEFHKAMSSFLKDSSDFHQQATSILEHHGHQIETAVKGLSAYEEAYVAQRNDIDVDLREFIQLAKKSIAKLDDDHRTLLEKLHAAMINGMSDTVTLIGQRFSDTNRLLLGYGENIEDSAKVIRSSMAQFSQTLTEMVQEIKIDSLSESHKQQAINTSYTDAIKILSGSIESHSSSAYNLAQTMAGIVSITTTYSANVAALKTMVTELNKRLESRVIHSKSSDLNKGDNDKSKGFFGRMWR